MADTLTLEVEKRTLTGKKVNRLRREGIIPATVYGKGVGPFAVQINGRVFADLLRKSGKTALVEVAIPGEGTKTALIHTIQRHPVTRTVIHADLLVVDLLVEITVDVPVHLVGESPLTKTGGAVVNQLLNSVSVRTLPSDIPSVLEADLSILDDLDKNILVSDLKLPGAGAIVNAPDDVVASITASSVAADAEADTDSATPSEPAIVGEEAAEDAAE